MASVIVDCAIYRSGVRQDFDGGLSETLAIAKGEDGGKAFAWIGLHEPTEEEFHGLREELGLHPLAVEDAASGHQRPKLERYGDMVFVVAKTASYGGDSQVTLGEIMLFVGTDYVITVRHGKANPLRDVRRRLEADPALLSKGPSAVLYGVCDEIVDAYDQITHDIEADLITLERKIFARGAQDVTEQVYGLKREVLEFRSAEDPLIPVVQEIAKGRVTQCDGTEELFRDVLDHLLRMDRAIDAHNELLTNILTAHLALLGKQQNEDVRKISAYAALLAIPTLIAGIYGMNFEHMPELSWTAGYPLAIGSMAGVCALVHRRFKKSHWL
ncbi:magnesium and cobalt transport protein CorA [Actinocorallia longicatena]|uniref:Magnesium/cobalt transporter CorA n=1 Tax=Actinocorallia longicatena TaxID=111803 RepID=A0ABP6PWY3_9ACTN